MNNTKKNVISGFLTILIIGLLMLSGPARAIEVTVNTQNIDVFDSDADYTFTISVQVNEGEFLPVQYTELIFDDGEDELTCTIEDNTADCDFINSVQTNVNNLDSRQDFGYGYGYGYGYGWQDFGYGYGYGSGTRGITGPGYGVITYTIGIDQSQLPGSFVGQDVKVEAKVYGGTDDNQANFRGSSTFDVSASEISETIADPTVENEINVGSSKITIPANLLTEVGATGLKVQQIAKTAVNAPTTATLKVMSKVFEFKLHNAGTDLPSGTKFNTPITLTISYTDDELTLAGITDESKIIPYYYDENTGTWVNDGISDIDRSVDNEITFKVSHFTKFSLLADTSVPITATAETPTSTAGGSVGSNRVTVTQEPEEEVEVPVEETTEETTEETPSGLGAITGAVIGGLKNNSSTIVVVVGVILVIGLVWRLSIKNPFGKGKGKNYIPSGSYH